MHSEVDVQGARRDGNISGVTLSVEKVAWAVSICKKRFEPMSALKGGSRDEDFTLPPLFQSESTGLQWTLVRLEIAQTPANVFSTIGVFSHAFARKTVE